MKKILISLTGLALSVFFVSQAPAVAAMMMGDVNRDGAVNFTDYQLIQPMFGSNNSAGDFNNNGIVDLMDINALIAKLYINQDPTPQNTTPTPVPSNTSVPSNTPGVGTPTKTPTATPTTKPGTTVTVTKVPTTTTKPTSTPIKTPTQTPNISPIITPIAGSNEIGPVALSYKKGGIWLTPEEIAQIPEDNSAWTSLVDWSNKPMNIVSDLPCTAGGTCGHDTTPKAMFARAIVGVKKNDTTKINELKAELDKVPAAIAAAKSVDDIKWPERNLGPIAAAANIIDYRPQPLLDSLHAALWDYKFGSFTVIYVATTELPNKPAWGKWAIITTAYLREDWDTINTIMKSHAKGLGEPLWSGKANDAPLHLTSMGNGDRWQEYNGQGGKTNPIIVIPAGLYYLDHGIGGLYVADQYRAANGPQWPPSFTNYIFEGMAPNITVSWAAQHLGYKDALYWGNYALLRSMIFASSTHDGKSRWMASSNDVWMNAAIMTWAQPKFGSTLPNDLKPEPDADVVWPLPVSPGGIPGRAMGWMYATHYARLAR